MFKSHLVYGTFCYSRLNGLRHRVLIIRNESKVILVSQSVSWDLGFLPECKLLIMVPPTRGLGEVLLDAQQTGCLVLDPDVVPARCQFTMSRAGRMGTKNYKAD